MFNNPPSINFGGGTGISRLAPIFARKRPRQALFAHPNNSQTEQNCSIQNDEGQPAYKHFYKGLPSKPQQTSHGLPNEGSKPTCTISRPRPEFGMQAQNSVWAEHNMRAPNGGGLVKQETQTSFQRARPLTTQRASQHQTQALEHLNVPQIQDQRGLAGNQRGGGGYQHQATARTSSASNFGGQQAYSGQNQRINMQSHHAHGPYGSAPRLNRMSFQGGAAQSMASPPLGQQPDWSQASLPHNSQHCQPLSRPTPQVTPMQPMQSRMLPSGPTPSSQHDKKGSQLDCSIRCITASIQGMQHWAQYCDKLPIIFEVYGVVNSALSSVDGNRAKEFLLKDEETTVKCIFYHIDRSLPRVTRGQWHRCIGKFDQKKELLRCVSIRPATEQEQKLHKYGIHASDAVMRKWVTKSKQAC